jgi:hypothetical protein
MQAHFFHLIAGTAPQEWGTGAFDRRANNPHRVGWGRCGGACLGGPRACDSTVWMDGMSRPCATPTATRATMVAGTLAAVPGVSRHAVDHSAKEAMSVRRPPQRCAAQPPGTCASGDSLSDALLCGEEAELLRPRAYVASVRTVPGGHKVCTMHRQHLRGDSGAATFTPGSLPHHHAASDAMCNLQGNEHRLEAAQAAPRGGRVRGCVARLRHRIPPEEGRQHGAFDSL